MLWMGKPLSEYSKGELIVILEALIKNLKEEEKRKTEAFGRLLG